jgi:hypothetical protein
MDSGDSHLLRADLHDKFGVSRVRRGQVVDEDKPLLGINHQSKCNQ